MSEFAIFDTSVLIDHWRTNRHAVRMAEFARLIGNSSVVLADIEAGNPRRKTTIAQLDNLN